MVLNSSWLFECPCSPGHRLVQDLRSLVATMWASENSESSQPTMVFAKCWLLDYPVLLQ